MAKDQKAQTPAPEATAKKGMSPETKAKLQKRVDDRKAAKVEVLEYLKQFDQTKPDEKKLFDQIMLFVGATTRTGGVRSAPISPTGALKDALVAAGTKGLTEMDIFKLFKIGRPEMIIKMRVLIQRAKEPKDRVWVTFTEGDETYRVVATGAATPKGWTGYVPETAETL